MYARETLLTLLLVTAGFALASAPASAAGSDPQTCALAENCRLQPIVEDGCATNATISGETCVYTAKLEFVGDRSTDDPDGIGLIHHTEIGTGHVYNHNTYNDWVTDDHDLRASILGNRIRVHLAGYLSLEEPPETRTGQIERSATVEALDLSTHAGAGIQWYNLLPRYCTLDTPVIDGRFNCGTQLVDDTLAPIMTELANTLP